MKISYLVDSREPARILNVFSFIYQFEWNKSLRLLLSCLCITAIALPASAQQLEEIVVTAQKREENIQDISISITAFTGETLRDFGVAQPRDLAQFTPGLTVNASSVYEGDSIFTIRGIGMNDVSSNQNPAVMMYLNDIALPSHVMLGFQIFDVDRIEVLKGPQGTLHGRNTTGGAIKVISKRPTQEFDLQARFDYAEYDRTEFELGVGGGLTDTLSARLAVNINVQQDGWQTLDTISQVPLGPGVDSNNGAIDRKSVRGSFLWEPNENFDTLLTLDYSKDDSEVLGFKHAGNLLVGGGGFCSFAITGVRDETACASFGQVRDSVGGTPLTPEIEVIQDQNPDERTILANFGVGNEVDAKSWGVTNSANWAFERMTATSVTGYREFKRFQPLDQGGAPVFTNEVQNFEDITSFTQELRLASDDSWGSLNWIVGFFYSKDDSDFLSTANFRDHSAFSGDFTTATTQETEGVSVFGQADWTFNDKWRLTGGVRYTDEDREFTYASSIVGTGPVPISSFVPDDINTEEVGYRVALDYMHSDDLLIYATFNRGFKSGGFPSAISFSIPQLLPFEAEELFAYELGFKSTLMDGTVKFNASAYYYDWNDMQATTAQDRIDPVSGQGVRVIVLSNAGDAEVVGMEAEVTWQATDELMFYTGLNWMEAEIKSGAFDGQSLAHAPDFTINGVARYESASRIAGVQPFAQLDFSYKDGSQFILPNHPGAVQRSHTLLNARIGFRTDDGKWEFAAWGRNLTDKVYVSELFGPGSGFLPGRIHYGAPRIFGVSLNYSH